MATKGYEKTIIDIDIDMDIVVAKEKTEWMRKIYMMYLLSEIIFFEKFEISKLVKCFRRWKVTKFFLFDETFNRRNILTDET